MQITEKQAYRIRYLVIPDFVFQNEKLSYLAAKVYSFIHGYRAPEFFFSNEKLAELFGVHEMSISKAISQLVKEGYIKTEQPNGRKRYIIDLWVSEEAYPGSAERLTHLQANGSAERLTQNVPNEGSNRRKNDEKSISNKNIYNKNNVENFVNEEEFADKGWLERKRARSEKKRSGNSTKVGFGNKTRFPKGNDYQENAPKKGGVDYTDVV